MAEREKETIVYTDGDRGGGTGLLAVVLLLAIVVVLFFVFGGTDLFGGADVTKDINVDVNLPGGGTSK
jgi:hypothetical protein